MSQILTSRVLFDDEGDLGAPLDSLDYARAIYWKARSSLNDAQRERDDLRIWISALREDSRFQRLTDRGGHHFLSWETFCTTPQPYGLGYDPEDIDLIIAERERKSAQHRAHEAKPLRAEAGRPAGNNVDIININHEGGTDPTYLTARIARDRPDILERMQAGEYASVRAAALDAGIVQRRVTCLPTVQGFARAIRRHLSPDEVTALIDLLTTGEVSS